jgi:hypothetical protein
VNIRSRVGPNYTVCGVCGRQDREESIPETTDMLDKQFWYQKGSKCTIWLSWSSGMCVLQVNGLAGAFAGGRACARRARGRQIFNAPPSGAPKSKFTFVFFMNLRYIFCVFHTKIMLNRSVFKKLGFHFRGGQESLQLF